MHIEFQVANLLKKQKQNDIHFHRKSLMRKGDAYTYKGELEVLTQRFVLL